MAVTEPAVVLVVAAADNGVIGRAGALPWRMPSDMRTFRRLTLGKPVVMGRRTFQSLKSPLKDRDNIVVSRDIGFAAEGIFVAQALAEALILARTCAQGRGVDEIAVIGGAEIYRLALPFAHRIYLTRVHGSPEGDTLLPELPETDWAETAREGLAPDPRDEYSATLLTLTRRGLPKSFM
jgi:dihydrofolate reductase